MCGGVLTRVFGSSPFVRVIESLIIERGIYDYTLKEIAEISEVSWTAFSKIYPKLEEMGIIKQTRKIGNAKLYALNEENELVKKLIFFSEKLSEHFIQIELEKQKEQLVEA